MAPLFIHLGAWLGLMLLAIGNGALREASFARWLNRPTAHAVSSLVLVALFALFVAGLHRWRPLPSAAQAWLVGGLWLLATVGFEFGFGRARGVGWDVLLGMYNPATGSLWLLVVTATLLLPPIFHHLTRLG